MEAFAIQRQSILRGFFTPLLVSSNNDVKTSVNKDINAATRSESWLLDCMMELLNSYVWDLKQQLVNMFSFSLFMVLWRYILYFIKRSNNQ